MLVGLASAGSHGVALLGQQVDSHAAHATSRASDQHRPLLRAGAIAFHGQQTHGCREASRAQDHGVKSRKCCWYLDDPGSWYTDIGSIAAKGANAQVIAGNEDPVTGSDRHRLAFDDGSSSVNAGHVRVVSDDTALPRCRQGVFVIERGICDGNRDVPGGKLVGSERRHLTLDTVVVLLDYVRSK